jgi:hypothetical protein
MSITEHFFEADAAIIAREALIYSPSGVSPTRLV